MDPSTTLLLAFGGNVALLAVLGYLGKSLIERFLQKDLKQFEADLKNKSDVAIQSLTNDLKIRALEHEIRFSSLHSKRAEVIESLYKLMVETLWAVEDFLNQMEWAGDVSKKDKYHKAMDELAALFRFFDTNQIYLPEPVCESFLGLIKELRDHAIHSGVYVRYDESNATPETLEKKYKSFEVGWNAIKSEIPKTRKALEAEFRSLLGAAPNPPLNSDPA